MRLQNYVTENKIKVLLNGQSREAARDKFEAVKWARNWWYPVYNLPLSNAVVQEAAAESLDAALGIDTEEWVPMADVKMVWPYSRQRFFQVVEAGDIERIEIDLGTSPFWVYNKEEIKEYLTVHATEGRLKKAVDDIETFMLEVENW